MIFQNPRAALNPIRAVGERIADAIMAHKRMSGNQARGEASELLRAVQIRDPEKWITAHPHELSGGMCRRLMIAMAEPRSLFRAPQHPYQTTGHGFADGKRLHPQTDRFNFTIGVYNIFRFGPAEQGNRSTGEFSAIIAFQEWRLLGFK